MTWSDGGGSHRVAAEVARSRAVEIGAPLLVAKLVGYVASYGGRNWQTYGKIAASIRKPNGGRYHVESVGRACRLASKNGVMPLKRIAPNGPLPVKRSNGRPQRSTYGATDKVISWARLGVPNPVTRGERRAAGQKQNEATTRRSLGDGSSALSSSFSTGHTAQNSQGSKRFASSTLQGTSRSENASSASRSYAINPLRPTPPPTDLWARMQLIGTGSVSRGSEGAPSKSAERSTARTVEEIDRELAKRDRERGPP